MRTDIEVLESALTPKKANWSAESRASVAAGCRRRAMRNRMAKRVAKHAGLVQAIREGKLSLEQAVAHLDNQDRLNNPSVFDTLEAAE